MISFLQGILASKRPDRVEIDVGGTGYEVLVSPRTLTSLPAVGQAVVLRTYLYVREDVLQLYGFAKESEREAFLMLLSVPGLGPKVALSALSTFSPADLYAAVRAGDSTTLRAIPGVGAKTAQQIVLSLREKVARLAEEATAPSGLAGDRWGQVLGALTGLGIPAPEARRALQEAVEKLGSGASIEDLVRQGLKSLR